MELTSSLSSEIARYLDLNTRQIQLTSANMANIDTPGYRAVGMDFEAEMRQAISGADSVAGWAEMSLTPRFFAVDGLYPAALDVVVAAVEHFPCLLKLVRIAEHGVLHELVFCAAGFVCEPVKPCLNFR